MNANFNCNEYFAENDVWLADRFKKTSSIVFGPCGSGKDLIFAQAIYLIGDTHYANQPYDYNTVVCPMSLFNVNGITNADIINRTITPYDNFILNDVNAFWSDGAIGLSCTKDSELNTEYPDFPIYFALRRQLNGLQFHANTQALGRIWKPFREQCNNFIWVQNCDDYSSFFIVNTICYEYYKSAEQMLLPSENTNGNIEYRSFLIEKCNLHYDTNYFRKVFYKNQNKKQETYNLLEALKIA